MSKAKTFNPQEMDRFQDDQEKKMHNCEHVWQVHEIGWVLYCMKCGKMEDFDDE